MKTQPALILMRPKLSAITDMRICRDAGWLPVLLEYQYLQPIPTALARLSQQSVAIDVIVWNSPGAVHVAAKSLPNQLNCIHVAIGMATASVLVEYGFTNIIYPENGHDSEAVARLPLWRVQQGKFLLIRGVGGRNWLLNYLNALGWEVDVAEVYQRKPQLLDWSLVKQQNNLQAIYLTTVVAVNAWFGQLPPDLYAFSKRLLYLVHHPRIFNAVCKHKVTTMLVPNLQCGLTDLLSSSKK